MECFVLNDVGTGLVHRVAAFERRPATRAHCKHACGPRYGKSLVRWVKVMSVEQGVNSRHHHRAPHRAIASRYSRACARSAGLPSISPLWTTAVVSAAESRRASGPQGRPRRAPSSWPQAARQAIGGFATRRGRSSMGAVSTSKGRPSNATSSRRRGEAGGENQAGRLIAGRLSGAGDKVLLTAAARSGAQLVPQSAPGDVVPPPISAGQQTPRRTGEQQL